MSQNLEAKVDKILKRIVEVDTKLERLDEIKSSVSNLEKKFDNLNDHPTYLLKKVPKKHVSRYNS